MVPVLNRPFLEYVIRHLSQHQVKEVVLALSHHQQFIETYFGDGSQFGVRLHYSVEDAPLGTAGAAKNAEKCLNETFMVLNGDIFTDLDITTMKEFHQAKKAKVTIAGTRVDDPSSYGLIEADVQGKITHFLEKLKPSEITTNLINAGTYILEPDVLTHIPPQASFSFERELFPQLLDQGEPLYAYDSPAYWIDMGTPAKYLQLHRDLLSSKSSRHTPPAERLLGQQSHVHPTAQIKGPVVISDNCTIGRKVKLTGPVVIGTGCIIHSEAIIEDSVIWHNVQIGQRTIVRHSIVADNCCLNANSIIQASTLGDNVTVASGCKLEPDSKIWPGTVVR
jgi:mannose-1-phosphate guanylyltransferase